MKGQIWILIITIIMMLFVDDAFCHYLKILKPERVEQVYRNFRRFDGTEEGKFSHLPLFRKCNQVPDDLVYTLYRNRIFARHGFWNHILRHYAKRFTFSFLFDSKLLAREVFDYRDSLINCQFAPIYALISAVCITVILIPIAFFWGLVWFHVVEFLWSLVSFQPIRRYIRDKVIYRELLERRKIAYMRLVMETNVRKPPKSKFRLYWMWRDHTYEEIPDVLAEQENDPLYPYIRGPGTSTETDDPFAEIDSEDEQYWTDEERAARELRKIENERLRLLELERDRKITSIAMKKLPPYKRLAIALGLPYLEDKKIMDWHDKVAKDRKLAKLERQRERLAKLGKSMPELDSKGNEIKKKRLTQRQIEDKRIMDLRVEDLIALLPDKLPISLALRSDKQVQAELERRNARKEQEIRSQQLKVRFEKEREHSKKNFQEMKGKMGPSPWKAPDIREIMKAKKIKEAQSLKDYYTNDLTVTQKKILEKRVKKQKKAATSAARAAKRKAIRAKYFPPPPTPYRPPPPPRPPTPEEETDIKKKKPGPPSSFNPLKPGPKPR